MAHTKVAEGTIKTIDDLREYLLLAIEQKDEDAVFDANTIEEIVRLCDVMLYIKLSREKFWKNARIFLTHPDNCCIPKDTMLMHLVKLLNVISPKSEVVKACSPFIANRFSRVD